MTMTNTKFWTMHSTHTKIICEIMTRTNDQALYFLVLLSYNNGLQKKGLFMIVVLDSALKHGFTKQEIEYAWSNIYAFARVREGKEPPHYMAIGSLPDGRTAEMIAFSTGFDWYIFHAYTPPTKGFLSEFNSSGKGKK